MGNTLGSQIVVSDTNEMSILNIDREDIYIGEYNTNTNTKHQRVGEWFEKYYHSYFSNSSKSFENPSRIVTIIRADIPIGWCVGIT